MTNSSTFVTHFRDELELRRRHLLDELDALMDEHLYGRVAERRREELVDDVGHLLADADEVLLRKFKATPHGNKTYFNTFSGGIEGKSTP
jgi:hypothetical protein